MGLGLTTGDIKRAWRIASAGMLVAACLILGSCSRGGKPDSTTDWPDSVDELMHRPTKIVLVMKALSEDQSDNIYIGGTNWEATIDKYAGFKYAGSVRIDVLIETDTYTVSMAQSDGVAKEISGALSPGQVEIYLNAQFPAIPENVGIKATVSVHNAGGRKTYVKTQDQAGGRILLIDRDGKQITGTSERENLSMVK